MNITNNIDPFLYRPLPTSPVIGKKNTQNDVPAEKKNLDFKQMLRANLSTSNFDNTPSREDVIHEIQNDSQKKKLYEAAREFESYFVEKVFREMNKNVHKSGFIDTGMGGEVFEEMLLTERVRAMNETAKFGLAEKMYSQLVGSS